MVHNRFLKASDLNAVAACFPPCPSPPHRPSSSPFSTRPPFPSSSPFLHLLQSGLLMWPSGQKAFLKRAALSSDKLEHYSLVLVRLLHGMVWLQCWRVVEQHLGVEKKVIVGQSGLVRPLSQSPVPLHEDTLTFVHKWEMRGMLNWIEKE